jgi:hypothetical protein
MLAWIYPSKVLAETDGTTAKTASPATIIE